MTSPCLEQPTAVIDQPIATAHEAPTSAEPELASLRDRLARLEQVLHDVVSDPTPDVVSAASVLPSDASQSTPDGAAVSAAAPLARASRRGMMLRVAAAFAGLGLASVTASAAHAEPPAPRRPIPTPAPTGPAPTSANNGGRSPTDGNLIIGALNTANAPTTITYLFNVPPAGGRSPHRNLLQVQNLSNVAGAASLAHPTSQKVSISGINSHAVTGEILTGEEHIGVYGWAPGGQGVVANGLWPLRIVPHPSQTAPISSDIAGNLAPSGSIFYGDVTIPAELWFKFFGTWKRIGSEDSAGVFVPITPTRVLNTGYTGQVIGFDGGTGAAIAAGQIPASVTRSYRINSKTFGAVAFPGDVAGLLFNVTIVHSVGVGGFVTVFNGDLGTAPGVASVNPSGISGITGNFGYTTIGPSGNIKVANVGSSVHVIIDVTGYYH